VIAWFLADMRAFAKVRWVITKLLELASVLLAVLLWAVTLLDKRGSNYLGGRSRNHRRHRRRLIGREMINRLTIGDQRESVRSEQSRLIGAIKQR
jgi:hypothetical protein